MDHILVCAARSDTGLPGFSETQPDSVLRGADCCCRPTWVGTYINALIAVICSIFFAATLLTVLPGVRFPRIGTCIVSGGVTLDS